MPIWVDADACPRAVKEILYRAAERTGIELVLVANQDISIPRSPLIRRVRVTRGLDVADGEIVRQVGPADLVVTADIPLAAAVLEKGALALDPRGDLHTPETIAERLSIRNFLDELRGTGVDTGGPAPFAARDRQRFANALDAWLQSRASPPAT
jgi:uncharacterized protein YaiI (UPF0178 family)